MQRAVPMVSYEDCASAADWLCTAFGFRQVGDRLLDDEGRVTHVELDRAGARVMLGWPGSAYRGPRRHAAACADASAWLHPPFVVDGVLLYVEDAEAHRATAREAGAEIVRDLEHAPPGRLYVAADPEGHRWMFVQPPMADPRSSSTG